jgi:hypothetical protein
MFAHSPVAHKTYCMTRCDDHRQVRPRTNQSPRSHDCSCSARCVPILWTFRNRHRELLWRRLIRNDAWSAELAVSPTTHGDEILSYRWSCCARDLGRYTPPPTYHAPQKPHCKYKALRTGKLEMWYLHAPDRTTPFTETFEAVNTLYEEGLFDRLGISNYQAWEVGYRRSTVTKTHTHSRLPDDWEGERRA